MTQCTQQSIHSNRNHLGKKRVWRREGRDSALGGKNLNPAEQTVLGAALSLALSTHSAQDTTPRADLQGPQPSQFSWLSRAAVLSALSTFQCRDCCRMSLTWDTMGFLLGSLSTMSGSSASGQNPITPASPCASPGGGTQENIPVVPPSSQGWQVARGTAL